MSMWAPMTVMKATRSVPAIQMTKDLAFSRSTSCCRLCAGSDIAPKVAIKAAPTHVRRVPTAENLVKGSFSSSVAKAVLKTSPDAWSVDRTGKGRVVIWIVLPIKLEATNMSIPACHLGLLHADFRSSYSFSSSRKWDCRCRVKPKLCTDVEISPTVTPI